MSGVSMKQLAAVLLEPPSRVHCSDLRDGDVSLTVREPRSNDRVVCNTGMATGLAEYALDLKPQQTANFTALLTLSAANPLTPGSLVSDFNYPCRQAPVPQGMADATVSRCHAAIPREETE